MSKFFINRPIVAMVIAILMVIVGAVTIASLPVAQFPNIVPPEIQLQASYVGADAQALEQSVATPIEQQVNGVDNMNYMYSLNATANSQTTLVANFDLKTDPNTDLILTQSRQQLAAGQLPPEVSTYGVTIRKSVTAPLMLVGLFSPKGTFDTKFLGNYAYINLNDPIARLYGVGQTQVFGAGQYAMRLWVQPDKLAKLGITVTDIVNAVQAQNTVNPAGQVGGQPVEWQARHRYPRLPVARFQCCPNGRRGSKTDGRDEEALPARHGLRDIAGSDERRHRGHEGNHRDPVDRHSTGHSCCLSLPARLACYADSIASRTGLAGGNLCFLPALRLLHQHTFDVRVSPRDRPCGR